MTKVFKPVMVKINGEWVERKEFQISRYGDLFNPTTGKILAKDRNSTTVLIDGQRVYIDKKKSAERTYGIIQAEKRPKKMVGLTPREIIHNAFNAGKFDTCYN